MDDLDLGATIKGFIPGQKVFNRYTLTRILGRGGMGVVWLARDEELERDVALKFLPEVVALDKQAVQELKRETRRSLELTHSHIVRIYDFIQDARAAAISMEYVAGETLAARKADQPGNCYEPAVIQDWVRQLCEALDYAHHKAEIVHRDLKPANLMIDGRGDLKVTDFGIAASVSDSVSRVSQQAGSSGTPVYMSPQQMMGEKPAITDDLYALGATLYDLLTGKPPFHSGNIMMQVVNKTPPSLAARRAELGVAGEPIPPEWEATIAACLAKEPKDRPQSAGEVLEQLRIGNGGLRRGGGRKEAQISAKTEDGAKLPTKSSDQSKIPNRKPKMAAMAAVAVVAALAAAGWYFGAYAPELRRRAESLAAERALLEREQRDHTAIIALIDAFADGSPASLRASTQGAVASYLAGAPARYHSEVEKRWTDRQTDWERARLAAVRDLIGRNLRQLSAAADQFFLENGVYEVTVDKLVGPGRNHYIKQLPSAAGEDYSRLGVLRQGQPISVTTPDGTSYVYDHPNLTVQPRQATRESVRLEAQPFPVAGQAFENGLGMKFVPVPGTNVLFSIWETRVQDYGAFARATGRAWSNANAGATHPAVNVSWEDAQAFCQWLTQEDRRAGRLGPDQSYRLPTDAEWSVAVGLPNEPGSTPADKDMKVKNHYPWGTQWPPPRGAGNYADETAKRRNPAWTIIQGYDDGHAGTAPVGSFTANAHGLYDLGGNVLEWVEDRWNSGSNSRVLRGASFSTYDPDGLLSSGRYGSAPGLRYVGSGFRVVVAVGSSAR
ncbi:MAG: SUMF1/EgtB/PvdO family nonheme iron enzyme [Opitutaceae bacterium]|nr:SUMF1/EgtB/PvdO family nonheme iron enzyme [Opitutaceae bacterium]